MLVAFNLVWVADLFKNLMETMAAPVHGSNDAKSRLPVVGTDPPKGSQVKHLWPDSGFSSTNMLCVTG